MNLSPNTLEIPTSNKPFHYKDNITQTEAYWLEVAQDIKELSEILEEKPP